MPMETKLSPQVATKFSIEAMVLLIGCGGFALFLFLITLFFLNLPRQALPQRVSNDNAEQSSAFVLPPTWTPRPTPEVIPTLPPTMVFTGRLAMHLYQPRPGKDPLMMPELPMLLQLSPKALAEREVLDLARILQGESPGDKEAAYRVGWVAKNRHNHSGYGQTYYEVSRGFFGYRADMQPSPVFIDIAKRIIRSYKDPTDGCLYALSRTDITNLGVPPHRADVAYGEWFFFKRWPLSYS